MFEVAVFVTACCNTACETFWLTSVGQSVVLVLAGRGWALLTFKRTWLGSGNRGD